MNIGWVWLIVTIVAGYFVVVLWSGAWRLIARSLAYHPWSEIAHGAARAFPTSRWQGRARLIGAPLAWCFAALMLTAFALFVGAVEIVFSPRDIYTALRDRS